MVPKRPPILPGLTSPPRPRAGFRSSFEVLEDRMLMATDAGLPSIQAADRPIYVADQPEAPFRGLRRDIEADLNGDGIPDLVELDPGLVYVSLGDRDGFFHLVQIISGPGARGIAVKDVDGDEIPDLIIRLVGGGSRIEYGQGDGTFVDFSAGRASLLATDPDFGFISYVGGGGIAFSSPETASAFPRSKFDAHASTRSFLTVIAQSDASGENQAGALPIAGPGATRDPIEVKAPDALLAGFLGFPSSLAFDSLSGNLLQSYSGASGIETASLLAFDFGNQEGPVTSALPPPTSSVARLLPIKETSLALIATLRSEASEGATEVRGDSASPTRDRSLGRPEGDPGPGISTAIGGVSRVEASRGLPRLTRLLLGLDESFDRLSREARRWGEPPSAPEGGAARSGTGDPVVEKWPSALNLVVPTANALLLDRVRPRPFSPPRVPDPVDDPDSFPRIGKRL